MTSMHFHTMEMDEEDRNAWEQSTSLDLKHTRLRSGFYPNGHSPPLSPHSSQYTPVPAFIGPTPQPQLQHSKDFQHQESRNPKAGQNSGPYSIEPPREPVLKRDQSAEPAEIYSNPAYPPPSQTPFNLPYARHSDELHFTPECLQQLNPPLYGCQLYEPRSATVRSGGIDFSFNYAQESEPIRQRRKTQRTSQACDACRAAKSKCDDLKPCSSCKLMGTKCTWKIPEPKYVDKAQARFLIELQTISKKVDSILKRLEIDPELVSDSVSGESEEEERKKELHTTSTTPQRVDSFICGEPLEEEEVGKALLPGEPAIPVGHTTGATRLLLWPAVQNFIGDKLKGKRENFIEYANIKESKHRLRIHGRGPGLGLAHSSDGLLDDGSDVSPRLELDESTVKRLLNSYSNNIHILHPILDLAELHTRTSSVEFVRFINREVKPYRGKRKRSLLASIAPYPLNLGRPQRSIENAVLFLVLALGRICEHRTKIADALPDYECASNGSPQAQGGYPSSMLDSLDASPQSLPSLKGDRNGSILRRGEGYVIPQTISLSGDLDAIPGYAYAVVAMEILCTEIGETTLHHVYANILTCLYFGQLARPSYSHRFISIASIGLQIILRPKLDQFQKYKPEPEKVPLSDNPLVFAFWTCLQLESDILAELDLPHSGITTLAMHMPWPNLEAAKAAGNMTAVQAESYQAQLYLRNHLNKIHQTVYGIGPMGKPLEEDYKLPNENAQSNFPVIEAMVESIPNMSKVAPSMMWEETDPPANDILSARLRAKYYGTEVITYRPFLKMVMNRLMLVENIPTKVLNYAKLCIKALENSTKAFHGMDGGQPIVTNVWGTAHAQWGNVILLQAAYRDPLLRDSIDSDNLRILVLKTIKFLKDTADQDSALMTDIEILELAAQKMGFLPERYSASFSSVRF